MRKASGGHENWECSWRIYICHGQGKGRSKAGVPGRLEPPPKMSMSQSQHLCTLPYLGKGLCRWNDQLYRFWRGGIILGYSSEPNLIVWVLKSRRSRRTDQGEEKTEEDTGKSGAWEGLNRLLLALKMETEATSQGMQEEAFRSRAFSWRPARKEYFILLLQGTEFCQQPKWSFK